MGVGFGGETKVRSRKRRTKDVGSLLERSPGLWEVRCKIGL